MRTYKKQIIPVPNRYQYIIAKVELTVDWKPAKRQNRSDPKKNNFLDF